MWFYEVVKCVLLFSCVGSVWARERSRRYERGAGNVAGLGNQRRGGFASVYLRLQQVLWQAGMFMCACLDRDSHILRWWGIWIGACEWRISIIVLVNVQDTRQMGQTHLYYCESSHYVGSQWSYTRGWAGGWDCQRWWSEVQWSIWPSQESSWWPSWECSIQ